MENLKKNWEKIRKGLTLLVLIQKKKRFNFTSSYTKKYQRKNTFHGQRYENFNYAYH